MLPLDLAPRVALVTGGQRGIGAAIAECLHAAGCRVIINYFDDAGGRNLAEAKALAERLGDGALALPGDVRDPDQIHRLTRRALEAFGTIDFLINNAGVIRDKSLKKMSFEEWQLVIQTDLTGVFTCCKIVGEHLAEGGRIVNLSSVSASVGFFGQANTAAAKAGVVGLTRVLCREFAKRRITVNAVAPGISLTAMGHSISEPVREQLLAHIPLGRFAEPHEIAQAVLFLCSPWADYITGQTLHVNGGWHG